MTRMNHELRNRQQHARDSLREEREEMYKQERLDRAAWKEMARTSTSADDDDCMVPRAFPKRGRDRGLKRRARKMRVRGTLASLQDLLLPLDLAGEWSEAPHRVWTLRCLDGAILNWAEGSGALWFQGPEDARSELERRVWKLLKAWFRRQAKKQGKRR